MDLTEKQQTILKELITETNANIQSLRATLNNERTYLNEARNGKGVNYLPIAEENVKKYETRLKSLQDRLELLKLIAE